MRGNTIARVAVARRALERSQREAAEQRIVGAVAAAAATEQDAARAVAVLNVQLADRIPQVVTSFGFIEGDTLEFQNSDGSLPVRIRVNRFISGVLDEGQLAGPTFPLHELDPISRMDNGGIRASSLTTSAASGEVVGARRGQLRGERPRRHREQRAIDLRLEVQHAALGGRRGRRPELHPVSVRLAGTVAVRDLQRVQRDPPLEPVEGRAPDKFLRWGQQAFSNFRVVPPGTGIVHQVNLELREAGPTDT